MMLLTISLNAGEAMKDKKTEIDFYKKGKLMWLIDTTERNKDYSLYPLSHYKGIAADLAGYSYENYLNHVNSKEEYKYDNWRLPTKEELLTLELKDSFVLRHFVSKEKRENEICIDTEIFYDHDETVGWYWTSTACEKYPEDFVKISFNGLRFKPSRGPRGVPAWGTAIGCGKQGKERLRLVRDTD